MTAQLAKTRLAAILPHDRINRMLDEQAAMCAETLARMLAGN